MRHLFYLIMGLLYILLASILLLLATVAISGPYWWLPLGIGVLIAAYALGWIINE
jgi:hypothetical protein